MKNELDLHKFVNLNKEKTNTAHAVTDVLKDSIVIYTVYTRYNIKIFYA